MDLDSASESHNADPRLLGELEDVASWDGLGMLGRIVGVGQGRWESRLLFGTGLLK